MSDSPENSSVSGTAKNVGLAGLLAISAGFISNQYGIKGEFRELLNMLIPPACVLLATFFSWLFGILKMGTAEEINAKRKMSKSIKQCKKELKNKDLSDDTKAQIQKKLDNLTLKRIDMGLPVT